MLRRSRETTHEIIKIPLSLSSTNSIIRVNVSLRARRIKDTPRSRHSLRSGPTKSTHLIRFQYSTQFPRLVKSLDGVDTLEREKEGKKIVKRRHLMSATFNPFAGSLSFRLRRVSSSYRVAVKGACTRGLASASRKFTWSDPRKIRLRSQVSGDQRVILPSPRNAAVPRGKTIIASLDLSLACTSRAP